MLNTDLQTSRDGMQADELHPPDPDRIESLYTWGSKGKETAVRLVLHLSLDELYVTPPALDQLVVTPFFLDPAVLDYMNNVCCPDSAQSVGDRNCGASFRSVR